MTRATGASGLLALTLTFVACDPNVVDAVREPAVMPVDVPVSPLKTALIHRYSFEGTGTAIVDSKGAAHGEVVGAELPGDGALPLAGGKEGPYVNLPNRLISGLSDATFEMWVTWTGVPAGGPAWQRLFDFGSSEIGEDGALAEEGGGTSYLFMTASSGVNVERGLLTSAMRVAYSQAGVTDEEFCQGIDNLPVAVPTHVALVVDQQSQAMTIYQNGQRVVSCPLKRPLEAIDDVNNWLGRSNYSGDSYFTGIFDEFRIYGAALTDAEIEDSERAGASAGL